MLKTLGFALALFAGLPAFGQQPLAAPATPYEYLLLTASDGGNAALDYGQRKYIGDKPATTELEKDDQEVHKLFRAVLALNYLSNRGWEYAGVSDRQESTGSTSAGSFRSYSITEYLLRRRKQ